MSTPQRINELVDNGFQVAYQHLTSDMAWEIGNRYLRLGYEVRTVGTSSLYLLDLLVRKK